MSRYSLLHQRTARHDLFSGQNINQGKNFQLKSVEYLLGTTNRLDDVIVLGMITMMTHGTYSLGKITTTTSTCQSRISDFLRGSQRSCEAGYVRDKVPHRALHRELFRPG